MNSQSIYFLKTAEQFEKKGYFKEADLFTKLSYKPAEKKIKYIENVEFFAKYFIMNGNIDFGMRIAQNAINNVYKNIHGSKNLRLAQKKNIHEIEEQLKTLKVLSIFSNKSFIKLSQAYQFGRAGQDWWANRIINLKYPEAQALGQASRAGDVAAKQQYYRLFSDVVDNLDDYKKQYADVLLKNLRRTKEPVPPQVAQELKQITYSNFNPYESAAPKINNAAPALNETFLQTYADAFKAAATDEEKIKILNQLDETRIQQLTQKLLREGEGALGEDIARVLKQKPNLTLVTQADNPAMVAERTAPYGASAGKAGTLTPRELEKVQYLLDNHLRNPAEKSFADGVRHILGRNPGNEQEVMRLLEKSGKLTLQEIDSAKQIASNYLASAGKAGAGAAETAGAAGKGAAGTAETAAAAGKGAAGTAETAGAAGKGAAGAAETAQAAGKAEGLMAQVANLPAFKNVMGIFQKAAPALKWLPPVAVAIELSAKYLSGEELDGYDFGKMIAGMMLIPPVAAAIAAIVPVGPALVSLAGVGAFGGFDVARFLSDPKKGLNLMGMNVALNDEQYDKMIADAIANASGQAPVIQQQQQAGLQQQQAGLQQAAMSKNKYFKQANKNEQIMKLSSIMQQNAINQMINKAIVSANSAKYYQNKIFKVAQVQQTGSGLKEVLDNYSQINNSSLAGIANSIKSNVQGVLSQITYLQEIIAKSANSAAEKSAFDNWVNIQTQAAQNYISQSSTTFSGFNIGESRKQEVEMVVNSLNSIPKIKQALDFGKSSQQMQQNQQMQPGTSNYSGSYFDLSHINPADYTGTAEQNEALRATITKKHQELGKLPKGQIYKDFAEAYTKAFGKFDQQPQQRIQNLSKPLNMAA